MRRIEQERSRNMERRGRMSNSEKGIRKGEKNYWLASASASVMHASLRPWFLISGLALSWATNVSYFEFSSYTTLWCNNLCLCLPSALCFNLC